MELLPRSSEEFSSAEYWEKFFTRRGDRAFEWYGEYAELSAVLHKYLRAQDKVLVVGCGNSELSEQLYDAGCAHLTNIDISETAIGRMKERNATKRPDMHFVLMDVLDLHFEDGSFQVALDKGTLDALASDQRVETMERVERMFGQLARVLRVGGRYVCVSLAQEHVLQALVGFFTRAGWPVRVHRMDSKARDGFHLPVFVIVCTKFCWPKGATGVTQVLEVCDSEAAPPRRLATPEDLLAAVRQSQAYALLRSKLGTRVDPGDEPALQLCHAASGQPRYSMHVVDSPPAGKGARRGHFAVFIVPQGRETDWLFGTAEGRSQLARTANFRRLLIVALHRGQDYGDMRAVQVELSAKVMELAPPSMPSNQQVPFLSDGGDLGSREVRHRGHSPLSGDFVVEDVRGEEGQLLRRLVFLSNTNVVQSESRLARRAAGRKKGKRKDAEPGGTSLLVDKSFLCCAHHRAMVAGLALLDEGRVAAEGQSVSVLLVGLGGGGLPQFLHDYVPRAQVEVVEIDAAMAEVASQWFGFQQDDRLTVTVADGLEVIKRRAQEGGHSYDIVMFDVDSKERTLGMSCPPAAFVEKPLLQCVWQLLAPRGIFVLNLVCRDPSLRGSVLAVLGDVFQKVLLRAIDEEVNEVLFCHKAEARPLAELPSAGHALERHLRTPGKPWDASLSLAALLDKVSLA
ncbi:eEF1A lysine and N-terminal methyltransferase isoform X1 [Polypterus senegalus]|uniref:eEF1A lysine and N-terminal methyltransferase isoform X1 n=1 Tax=Polypterus senegalus TaxID=55291 RepID=UPI001965E334|nr:eEF1A lysine and N-terminal methyltransferase isoform X1 [Polypterus senegalus]